MLKPTKDREFNKTQHLIFASAAEPHLQKLKTWFRLICDSTTVCQTIL